MVNHGQDTSAGNNKARAGEPYMWDIIFKKEKKYLSVEAHQIDELNRCKFRLWYSFKMGVSPSSLLKGEFKELTVPKRIQEETEETEIYKIEICNERPKSRKKSLGDEISWGLTTKNTSELIKEAKDTAIKYPLISTVITFPDYSSSRPKNAPLRLSGNPDMLIKNPLDPSGYYYCPVEIKAHKQPRENDFRRILFYSLIMRKEFYPETGFGKKKASKIHGFLWLNSENRKELEEYRTPAAETIDLLETKDFDEVLVKRIHSSFNKDFDSYLLSGRHYNLMRDIETIADLQRKIQEPLYSVIPVPKVSSECSKCTLQEECYSRLKGRDLLTVHGIGPKTRSLFIELGCETLGELYELGECWKEKPNVKKVEDALMEKIGKSWRSKIIGYWNIEKILRGVKANVEERIVAQKLKLPSGKTECFLDLEYDEPKRPFCIGMKVRKGFKSNSYQWFLDEEALTSKTINKAREILKKKNPIVYVWGGQDAKILGLGESCIDLYQEIQKNVGLPSKSYKLKDVAKYLGYEPPKMPISDGLECLMWYTRYKIEEDKKKKEHIKQEILDYNMNDVECLEYIFDTLIAKKP